MKTLSVQMWFSVFGWSNTEETPQNRISAAFLPLTGEDGLAVSSGSQQLLWQEEVCSWRLTQTCRFEPQAGPAVALMKAGASAPPLISSASLFFIFVRSRLSCIQTFGVYSSVFSCQSFKRPSPSSNPTAESISSFCFCAVRMWSNVPAAAKTLLLFSKSLG